MRRSIVATSGTGVALAAWATFLLGSGFVAATAFMLGVFAVLVTSGLLIASTLEDHGDRMLGWMWRTTNRLPLSSRRKATGTRCAICRQPLQLAGSLRVCLDCDLVRTIA